MPGITVTEGWRNQQWIRLRCASRGIADWVGQFGGAFSDPEGTPPTARWPGPTSMADMPSYALTVARRREFNARIDELLELAERWSMPPAKDVFRSLVAPFSP